METQIHESIANFDPGQWNALVEAGNPFMCHEFLRALEESHCTGPGKPWHPLHIGVFDQGKLIAAIAAFMRSDSYGEYIFDWAWASAYSQAGHEYYPKITVAAPFTPATGNRILLHPEAAAGTLEHLLTALDQLATGQRVSGIHILCLTREEQRLLSGHGYLARLTHQYHWINRDFTTFDDYLQNLRAHRRKEIKRERRRANELGLSFETFTGDAITPGHMKSMYRFYLQTYSRKWGSPYLNEQAFLLLHEYMRKDLVLVMAREGDTYVAGAIAFRNGDRLFGRYWGADGHYPYLHFELCFYQLIEFAIANKIRLFEAGAQGEHKFQRGFAAMPVYSAHKLFDPQGSRAIARFLDQERRATSRALQLYRAASPNKSEPAYIPELSD